MYKDKTKDLALRVEDLLTQMTLDEKLAQLASDLPMSFLEKDAVSREKLQAKCKDGLGRITQYSIAGLDSKENMARISNQIQRYFVEETRLGIPVILQAESLSGYPADGGTMFPAMINAAATFHPELVEAMSTVIGNECKAVGVRQALSPLFDIARDPRWGRVYETFGEDPYLVAQMGCAYVRGLQKNMVDGVMATGKHFLGYAETQAGLNLAATRLNDRELYESFATPFEAGIREANLRSIMASYSEIDGIPCGANTKICRELLRDVMKFDGVLVSDGAAIWKMFNTFGIAKDYPEAGYLAMKGGLDTEMPVGTAYRKLGRYIETGELEEELVDEAVRRVLTSKFELGLFDQPYIDEDKIFSVMQQKESVEVSKKITEQSIILLKNEAEILPLAQAKKIAVIGPHADAVRPGISGYTAISYYEMLAGMRSPQKSQPTFHGIMDEKNKAEEKEDTYDTAFSLAGNLLSEELEVERLLQTKYRGTTLAGELGKRQVVCYAQGCEIVGTSKEGFPKAIEVASEADLVVLAMGGNCGWTNCTGGEGKDRTSLELPGMQQALLDELAKTGKDIVLVLYGPGQYAPGLYANVKAIVQAWLPGAYGAEAIAKVLCGETNPSGKLPMTMPRNVGQVPIFYNHKRGNGYTTVVDKTGVDNIEIFSGGYVDVQNTPLYPFGFGLSYSKFSLENIQVASPTVLTNGVIHLQCEIKNVGLQNGAEVVQLYYRDCEARVTRPVRQLAGFKRVELAAGECKKLFFELDTAQLGFYNEDMDFVVEPGTVELLLGTSSEDFAYKGNVVLTGKTINVMGRRAYTCVVRVES